MTEQSFFGLSEDLIKGAEVALGEQELAAYSLEKALALGVPQEVAKQCATAVLEVAQRELGPIPDTCKALPKALGLFEPEKMGGLHYNVCMWFGEWLRRDGRFHEAVSYHEKAAQIAQQGPDLSAQERELLAHYAEGKAGQVLVDRGDIATGRERIEAALSWVSEHAPELGPAGDRICARLLTYRADALREAGMMSAALTDQERAVGIYDALLAGYREDPWDWAGARMSLARLEGEVGQHEKARLIGRQAVDEVKRALERLPLARDPFLRLMQLGYARVLQRGGFSDEYEELVETILDEHGMEAAAEAGHAGAKGVWPCPIQKPVLPTCPVVAESTGHARK